MLVGDEAQERLEFAARLDASLCAADGDVDATDDDEGFRSWLLSSSSYPPPGPWPSTPHDFATQTRRWTLASCRAACADADAK